MLKVVIIESLGFSGIAHYTFSLCNALADTGQADVTLVTQKPYELQDKPRRFEIETILDGMNKNRSKLWRGFEYLRSTSQVTRRAHLWRADIIHVQNNLLPAWDGVWLRQLRSACRALVYTVHDVQGKALFVPGHTLTVWDKWSYRNLYDAPHRLIAHSEHSKQELEHVYHVASTKIRVLPLGNYTFLRGQDEMSQEQARRILGVPSEAQVVLFFGSIRGAKGLEYLLRAVASLVADVPELWLLVAGAPLKTTWEPYQALIDSLGLSQRTIAHPRYIPNEEISTYFAASDAVALPYLEVYQSAVLQLAYAFGRPVITTNVGGMPDVVEDGQTGYLVPPGDSEALASAIHRTMIDRDRARRMGEAGRRLAQTTFAWDAIASNTLDVYRELLAQLLEATTSPQTG